VTRLSAAQYGFLTEPINAGRVQHLRGNAHLEQWDIRRHLIRCFGFGGFDVETKSSKMLAQIEHPPQKDGDKPRWTVVWAAEVRLTIKSAEGAVIAVYEDGATGDSQNQPSLGDAHDQALKTALSQALKRCAVNLGDQFGLSLYNGGKADAVVHRTLVAPMGAADREKPAEETVLPEPAPVDGWDPHEQQVLRNGYEAEIADVKSEQELSEVSRRIQSASRKREISKATFDHLKVAGEAKRAALNGATS